MWAVLPCHLPTTRDPVFHRNEEPLTGQSGPVNLAGKMPPKDSKTDESGERKTKKKSPTGKKKATVIRDEPERNLFLECLLSVNQPPTATEPPERRRSARQSQSTPSPSTQKESPNGKEECVQTLKQQSTKRSTRLSRSTTPSPETPPEEVKRRNKSTIPKEIWRPGGKERYPIQTAL